ncbi:hypothetical protein [Phytoactinopolyspora endophytica]|uniref:PH-like domain-containing protein n=1 Tax=Phytoactinopolyspora endophytica TaxID=1642495 RepID=UPI00101CEFF4|nr:hypothetical protein [Phytoactinopolyspora endophytica]
MDLRTGVAVAILGLVLVGSYLLMWRGWRRRAGTQVNLPPLPPVSTDSAAGRSDFPLLSRGRRAARVAGCVDPPPTEDRRRKSDLPDSRDETTLGPVDTVYAGTTMAGDWMERVLAHGLGRRSSASVTITPQGILLERGPEPSFVIPGESVRAVRTDRAGAGRAVRRAEYVIITWEHGEVVLDTSLRPRRREDRARIEEAVTAVMTHEASR